MSESACPDGVADGSVDEEGAGDAVVDEDLGGGAKNTVSVAGPSWSLERLTVIDIAGLWYLSRGRCLRQTLRAPRWPSLILRAKSRCIRLTLFDKTAAPGPIRTSRSYTVLLPSVLRHYKAVFLYSLSAHIVSETKFSSDSSITYCFQLLCALGHIHCRCGSNLGTVDAAVIFFTSAITQKTLAFLEVEAAQHAYCLRLIHHSYCTLDCKLIADMISSGFFARGSRVLRQLRNPWRQDSLPKVQKLAIATSTFPSTPAPKINRDRLWADIHYTCQFGQGERWGQ